jgi:acetyltransferase-like isoleucine patch superfamily enzyme
MSPTPKSARIKEALSAPWKIWNEIARLFVAPRVRLMFALNGIPWRSGWKFFGAPVIQKHRRSSMTFGPGMQLRSSLRSNPLGPNHPVFLTTWQAGACLQIGKNFAMTGGSVCVAERIMIGDNVAVGANCTIVDTDFHPLDPNQRQQNPNDARTAPVILEDNVFVGMNCLILKGVTIGQGSVIGAGSVVTKSIPPRVIAAGNPARVIRAMDH